MTDWETRSMHYVVAAIESAEKRQRSLWKKVTAKRTKDGVIALDWPLINEYVEACRRLHSLMIDLETVGHEYEVKRAGGKKPAAVGRKKAAAKKRK
jgi:hypothetical protein